MNPTPSHLSDERALFAQMAQGHASAFGIVLRHYTAQIQPFIFSLTRSESAAEEIVQEVFLTIWLKREKMSEVTCRAGWSRR